MNSISFNSLKLFNVISLILLLFAASVFSLLETSIVAITEHKLNSLKNKFFWAKCAYLLKLQTNQVLIFSLFGNSLFNAIFTTATTIMVNSVLTQTYPLITIPLTTTLIAFFIIIFSEAVPKIIAARSPALILSFIAIPLYYLFIASRFIVKLIDKLVYLIIKSLHLSHDESTSLEEIRAIISDKRSPLKERHRSILLNSMELESLTIKEVLIPIRMVEAININDPVEVNYKKIYTTHHTRIIVYRNTPDNIIGFIHVKDFLALTKANLTLSYSNEFLLQILRPITYVQDFIPIMKQLNRAQKYKTRIFTVINEYGDILGIACLEDMLEMIFGNFTTESPKQKLLAVKNEYEQLIVDGTMLIRELNKLYNLNIPITSNTFTINGLVLKALNGIPAPGVCFKLNNLIFEVISVGNYWVERVKITKE